MTQKEVKSFAFEVKEFGNDNEYYTFEGYASTFGNTDLDGDIIDAGAFDKFLATNKQIPILWSHEMNMPIGKSTQLTIDSKGLYIKARMPKDDDFVKGRVMPQMKVGSIEEMSIGFFVKDYDIEKGTRHIKEIDLFETSLVAKAANPKALISGFKAFSGKTNLPLAPKDTPWDSSMAVKHIRLLSNSLESPSPSYKNYFMVYNAEEPENFGSYKLPFVDVIGDKAVIVPRAVYAIAAALQGARGGVELSESDRSKVESAVNKLYKKMADEFNDDSIVSPLSKYHDEDDKEEEEKAQKEVTNAIRKALVNKVEDHNEQVGDVKSKRTNLSTLEKVFNRGVGAYNTNPGSVRPNVNSPEQWAMGRVNSYLYALRNGRFRSGKHDTDLLPDGHPMASQENSGKSFESLREIEAELKNSGFSQSEAKTMISKIKELTQRDAEQENQREVDSKEYTKALGELFSELQKI
jgi:HK97 family phage prohead protease